MEERGYPAHMNFQYHVCAIVFGTDETILDLSLTDGLTFVRRSLNPRVSHLDKIFGRDAIGLRRDYELARIDDQTVDVICIEKDVITELETACSDEHYDQMVEHDLSLIDDCLRAIRFVKECSLRCKSIAFQMVSERPANDCGQDGKLGAMSYTSLIPISEAAGSPDIVKFHCESNEIAGLISAISKVHFPIHNETLNLAHRFYDLSYHTENYISITILFTALEVLFIDSEPNKKERLAKRCAVFLNDDKDSRLEYYHRIRDAYKQRSEFVHDGNFVDIKDSTIVFLRSCVRNSLLKMLSLNYNKRTLIESLKQQIVALDYWQQDQ